MDHEYLKLANTLLDYSLELKKSESIVICTDDAGLEFAKLVSIEAIKKGGKPFIHFDSSDIRESMLRHYETEDLSYKNPDLLNLYTNSDAVLYIRGNYNTKQFENIDPKKVLALQKAKTWITRAVLANYDLGKTRWCITQIPTHAQAGEACMSMFEYTGFLMMACGIKDGMDPIKYWRGLEKNQEGIIQRISTFDEFRVIGDKTDISFSTKGRKWVNSSGKTNFPSGEIFTSPVEDSVNGHIFFDYPLIYFGKEMTNIHLYVKDGKIYDAFAEKNEDFLIDILNTDSGSRTFGEFAFGNNYNIDKFTNNILFDEKIGGTIHMAVGNSYKKALGENVSDIHLDIVKEMKISSEVFANGRSIYRDGRFKI